MKVKSFKKWKCVDNYAKKNNFNYLDRRAFKEQKM